MASLRSSLCDSARLGLKKKKQAGEWALGCTMGKVHRQLTDWEEIFAVEKPKKHNVRNQGE